MDISQDIELGWYGSQIILNQAIIDCLGIELKSLSLKGEEAPSKLQ